MKVYLHNISVHFQSYTLSDILVRAECELCPWAAGRNVGGHSTWHYFAIFFSLSESLTFLPERRQLGLQNCARAPKSQ
jgi:hypothetical protein